MKYAILGLRRLLRSIENQCVTCRKRKASTIQPICPICMSNVSDISNHPSIIRVWITLDRFTFRFAEALKKDGDFFLLASPPGLYTLRLYHLWTPVLVSWALNGSLRVVASFIAPSTIWSDNGTNFVGAEKELLACIKSWNGMAPTIFAHKGVTWKFNPPGAPHHCGSWERLVRSVKRVLYDILGSRRVTEEVLGTTLCLVEQALNSRPITPVSTDSRELKALTPNHFLLGQHATSFPSLLPRGALRSQEKVRASAVLC